MSKKEWWQNMIIMNKKMRYDIEKKLSSLSKEGLVGSYKKDNKCWIINYCIYYDEKYNSFFGISAQRLLDNNYQSLQLIESAKDIITVDNNCWSCNLDISLKIVLFNIDLFYDKHPECDLEIINKLAKDEIEEPKLLYALTYKRYPCINVLLGKGFKKIVEKIIEGDFNDNISLINLEGTNEYEIINLPKMIVDYIKEHSIYDYLDIYELYNVHHMSEKRIIQLIEEYGNNCLRTIKEIIRDVPQSKIKNVMDYLSKCDLRQGIDYQNALCIYETYITNAKKVFVHIDYEPKELAKAESIVLSRVHKINASLIEEKKREYYKLLYNHYIKERGETNDYLIRPVINLDYRKFLSPRMKRGSIANNVPDGICFIAYRKTDYFPQAIIEIEPLYISTAYSPTVSTHKKRQIKRWAKTYQKKMTNQRL